MCSSLECGIREHKDEKNSFLHVFNAPSCCIGRTKKNETEPTIGCFRLAKIDHSMGHNVNLFLLDVAALCADQTTDFNPKTLTDDVPDGNRPIYLNNRGLQAPEFRA